MFTDHEPNDHPVALFQSNTGSCNLPTSPIISSPSTRTYKMNRDSGSTMTNPAGSSCFRSQSDRDKAPNVHSTADTTAPIRKHVSQPNLVVNRRQKLNSKRSHRVKKRSPLRHIKEHRESKPSAPTNHRKKRRPIPSLDTTKGGARGTSRTAKHQSAKSSDTASTLKRRRSKSRNMENVEIVQPTNHLFKSSSAGTRSGSDHQRGASTRHKRRRRETAKSAKRKGKRRRNFSEPQPVGSLSASSTPKARHSRRPSYKLRGRGATPKGHGYSSSDRMNRTVAATARSNRKRSNTPTATTRPDDLFEEKLLSTRTRRRNGRAHKETQKKRAQRDRDRGATARRKKRGGRSLRKSTDSSSKSARSLRSDSTSMSPLPPRHDMAHSNSAEMEWTMDSDIEFLGFSQKERRHKFVRPTLGIQRSVKSPREDEQAVFLGVYDARCCSLERREMSYFSGRDCMWIVIPIQDTLRRRDRRISFEGEGVRKRRVHRPLRRRNRPNSRFKISDINTDRIAFGGPGMMTTKRAMGRTMPIRYLRSRTRHRTAQTLGTGERVRERISSSIYCLICWDQRRRTLERNRRKLMFPENHCGLRLSPKWAGVIL